MVEISDRSVYRYILEARPIKIVGKQYFHVQIARGMDLPAASMLVKQVLDRLIDKGYVQVFKKALTVTLPVDPEALSDEPVINRPPPEILPDLDGKTVLARGLGRPSGMPVASGEADLPEPAANADPEPAVAARAAEEAAASLPTGVPRRTATSSRTRSRRTVRGPDPSPSAKMQARNKRLEADNERLKRELAAAERAREIAEARLADRRRPATVVMIRQLIMLLTAMRYEAEFALSQAKLQLEAARAGEESALGQVRTLEKQAAHSGHDEPGGISPTDVARLTREVETLERAKAELGRRTEELLRTLRERDEQIRELEHDRDLDSGEREKMVEQLAEQEVIADLLRKGRRVTRTRLDCGHNVLLVVDQGHDSLSRLTRCRPAKVTSTVR